MVQKTTGYITTNKNMYGLTKVCFPQNLHVMNITFLICEVFNSLNYQCIMRSISYKHLCNARDSLKSK